MEAWRIVIKLLQEMRLRDQGGLEFSSSSSKDKRMDEGDIRLESIELANVEYGKGT